MENISRTKDVVPTLKAGNFKYTQLRDVAKIFELGERLLTDRIATMSLNDVCQTAWAFGFNFGSA